MTVEKARIQKKAIEMARMTGSYIQRTETDFGNPDCVEMYDLDNRLSIYLNEIDVNHQIDEAFDMLEAIIKAEPFVTKIYNAIKD